MEQEATPESLQLFRVPHGDVRRHVKLPPPKVEGAMENMSYKVLHSDYTTRKQNLMLLPDDVAAILRLKKLG